MRLLRLPHRSRSRRILHGALLRLQLPRQGRDSDGPPAAILGQAHLAADGLAGRGGREERYMIRKVVELYPSPRRDSMSAPSVMRRGWVRLDCGHYAPGFRSKVGDEMDCNLCRDVRP